MAVGTSYVKHDATGAIVGTGFISADMLDKQVVEPGHKLVPATGQHVQEINNAHQAGLPCPYRVAVEHKTKLTIIDFEDGYDESVGKILVQTVKDVMFDGMVVSVTAPDTTPLEFQAGKSMVPLPRRQASKQANSTRAPALSTAHIGKSLG